MKIFKNVLMAIACIMLYSCTHSESEKIITTGTWHITDLSNNNINLKDNFASYTFQFKDNHKIVVTGKEHTYKGTWTIKSNLITDDDPQTDITFTINFDKKDDLSALNHEWRISEMGLDKISLGEKTGGQDFLVFHKAR